MREVTKMIYTALRDDSKATIGIRALLGHAATPWGVYYAYRPEKPDFASGKKYLTFYSLGAVTDLDYHGRYNQLLQETFPITAWGPHDNCEIILARVRFLLHDLHNVTLPTTESIVHTGKVEWVSPIDFDEDFRQFNQSVRVRIWYRNADI